MSKRQSALFTNRIARLVLDTINVNESTESHDRAPSIESLEPRVLLSATPLADILKDNTNQVYALQATSGSGFEQASSPEVRAAYSAPSARMTYPNFHFQGVVDINVSITAGTLTVAEWGVNLVDRITGEVVASLATGTGPGNTVVSFDSTLFEDGG